MEKKSQASNNDACYYFSAIPPFGWLSRLGYPTCVIKLDLTNNEWIWQAWHPMEIGMVQWSAPMILNPKDLEAKGSQPSKPTEWILCVSSFPWSWLQSWNEPAKTTSNHVSKGRFKFHLRTESKILSLTNTDTDTNLTLPYTPNPPFYDLRLMRQSKLYMTCSDSSIWFHTWKSVWNQPTLETTSSSLYDGIRLDVDVQNQRWSWRTSEQSNTILSGSLRSNSSIFTISGNDDKVAALTHPMTSSTWFTLTQLRPLLSWIEDVQKQKPMSWSISSNYPLYFETTSDDPEQLIACIAPAEEEDTTMKSTTTAPSSDSKSSSSSSISDRHSSS